MENLSQTTGGNEVSNTLLINSGFPPPQLTVRRKRCTSAVMIASSNLSRMHDRDKIRKKIE